MNYNYALITDGIVSNIIVLHPNNASDFPNAVPMGDYPVSIGDAYDGTNFLRGGEVIKTAAQRLQEENAELVEAFMILGVNAYLMEDTPNE